MINRAALALGYTTYLLMILIGMAVFAFPAWTKEKIENQVNAWLYWNSDQAIRRDIVREGNVCVKEQCAWVVLEYPASAVTQIHFFDRYSWDLFVSEGWSDWRIRSTGPAVADGPMLDAEFTVSTAAEEYALLEMRYDMKYEYGVQDLPATAVVVTLKQFHETPHDGFVMDCPEAGPMIGTGFMSTQCARTKPYSHATYIPEKPFWM